MGWLDAAGGEVHPVTAVKLAQSMRFHPQAFWSPDGTRLYFRDPIEPKKPTDDPKNDLVSVRLDGTDKRRYLRVPAGGRPGAVAGRALGRLHVARHRVRGRDPRHRHQGAAGGVAEGGRGAGVARLGCGGRVRRAGPTAAGRSPGAWDRRSTGWAWTRPSRSRRSSGGMAEEKEKAAGAARGATAAKDKAKTEAKKDEDELKLPPAEAIEIQPRPAARAAAEGSFVLKNARVVTMKGDAVLDDADVVVTGNRIAAVGRVRAGRGPAGSAGVGRAAARPSSPGSSTPTRTCTTRASRSSRRRSGSTPPTWPTASPPPTTRPRRRSTCSPRRRWWRRALMLGPRVYSSGDVLYGGQQTDIWAEVNNLADARRQVRRMKAYGARMIKVYQQPRRSQRIWFAEASRERAACC